MARARASRRLGDEADRSVAGMQCSSAARRGRRQLAQHQTRPRSPGCCPASNGNRRAGPRERRRRARLGVHARAQRDAAHVLADDLPELVDAHVLHEPHQARLLAVDARAIVPAAQPRALHFAACAATRAPQSARRVRPPTCERALRRPRPRRHALLHRRDNSHHQPRASSPGRGMQLTCAWHVFTRTGAHSGGGAGNPGWSRRFNSRPTLTLPLPLPWKLQGRARAGMPPATPCSTARPGRPPGTCRPEWTSRCA